MPEYAPKPLPLADAHGASVRTPVIDAPISQFRIPPGSVATTKAVQTVKSISGDGVSIDLPVGTRVRVIGIRDDAMRRVVEVVEGPAARWRAVFEVSDLQPA